MLANLAVARSTVRTKPWLVLYLLLAAGLLAYYGLLGARYVNASSSVAALSGRAEVLSREVRATSTGSVPLAPTTPESAQQRYAAAQARFTYATSDDLIAALVATARQAGVDLASISMGQPTPKTQNGTLYQTQPMTVALQGTLPQLQLFLERFQARVPVTAVATMSIAAERGVPLANVQFVFSLSPQAAPEGKGSK